MFIHGDNVSGFLESKDSHIQFLKMHAASLLQMRWCPLHFYMLGLDSRHDIDGTDMKDDAIQHCR